MKFGMGPSKEAPYWVKLLQVLANYDEPDMIAPAALTAPALAEAIGTSDAHTRITINRMEQDGLVDHKLAHIDREGQKRRIYAYYATPQGRDALRSWANRSEIIQGIKQKVLVDPDDIETLQKMLQRAEGKRRIGVEIAGVALAIGLGVGTLYLATRRPEGEL